jgi:hypothetical protein
VLTQPHWDTEQAISLCEVAPVRAGELEPLNAAGGVEVERIVDFDTFEVFRVTLQEGRDLYLDTLATARDYAQVMTVSGNASVAGEDLPPSNAVLIPRGCANWRLAARDRTVVVVACPKVAGLC